MQNERMREIAAKVATMSEDQRAELAARMPVLTIERHAISARNVCLIAAQTDQPVTIIGGFRQWLANGRAVRRGEKAVYILRPTQRKGVQDLDEGPAQREGVQDLTHAAGARRFVPVPVFDVSQTDELPEGQRARVMH